MDEEQAMPTRPFLLKSGSAYVVRDQEARPSPVVGSPYPDSSPPPTGAFRSILMRFMKLKQTNRREQ
jgi:hypothetical protein